MKLSNLASALFSYTHLPFEEVPPLPAHYDGFKKSLGHSHASGLCSQSIFQITAESEAYRRRLRGLKAWNCPKGTFAQQICEQRSDSKPL